MAVIGYLATLSYVNGSSPIPIPEVVTITVPMTEVSVIDATHLGVSNSHKVFIPGLRDGGTLTAEANFISETYIDLKALEGQTIGWVVGSPAGDAVDITFDGFLTKVGPTSFEAEGVAKLSLEVKVTGPVTISA